MAWWVVICLKNRTFAVLQTTSTLLLLANNWLWFAWKIVLLLYCKQRQRLLDDGHGSCDLLEKSYFCCIANNFCSSVSVCWPVVICLKNRTFAVLQTTMYNIIQTKKELWFAWKIVLLLYCKQLAVGDVEAWPSCDLLEKSYFCCIANNPSAIDLPTTFVVICLKNRTFAVLQTTHTEWRSRPHPLWFAWKIVLLLYCKQRWPRLQWVLPCCDLLEKSYFCCIANNVQYATIAAKLLWFAWKIVLLLYCKQQHGHAESSQESCDLLEKSYFCCIANNALATSARSGRVVICLKNRTFAVLQTTKG